MSSLNQVCFMMCEGEIISVCPPRKNYGGDFDNNAEVSNSSKFWKFFLTIIFSALLLKRTAHSRNTVIITGKNGCSGSLDPLEQRSLIPSRPTIFFDHPDQSEHPRE